MDWRTDSPAGRTTWFGRVGRKQARLACRCEILCRLRHCLARTQTKARSGCQPGNRRLTDVVAAGNAALCLAGVEAFAGLALLVRGECRLTAEFYALGFGAGPTPPPAL